MIFMYLSTLSEIYGTRTRDAQRDGSPGTGWVKTAKGTGRVGSGP